MELTNQAYQILSDDYNLGEDLIKESRLYLKKSLNDTYVKKHSNPNIDIKVNVNYLLFVF